MAEAPAPEMKLQPNAFEPLQVERRLQTLSRPSLSYWQDAWVRLRANRRALLSLYIVVGLIYLGFSTVITLTVMGLERFGQRTTRVS